MKQSDIDKRIIELTEEAKLLEAQRNALEALDICAQNGHTIRIAQEGIDTNFYNTEYIILECECCGALCTLAAAYGATERAVWTFPTNGPFGGKTVQSVFQIESTDPLPEPEPTKTEAPSEAEEAPVVYDSGDMQTVDETDTKGFYRVKFGSGEA